MKEFVMCNKNLRLKVHSRSTDHESLLKEGNFNFAFFRGRRVDSYLKSDFSEGKVTKIFNFALKISGVVGRVTHTKCTSFQEISLMLVLK